MTKDINDVYAKFFTKDNKEKAKKVLDGDRFMVSNQDLFIVSFLAGGSFLVIILTFLFCLMEDHLSFNEEFMMSGIKAFTPVSRILFFFTYIIIATGFIIRIFR